MRLSRRIGLNVCRDCSRAEKNSISRKDTFSWPDPMQLRCCMQIKAVNIRKVLALYAP